MVNCPIILDHVNEISLDSSNPPFNNYQAFKYNYEGLKMLADTVREHEIEYVKNDPHAAHVSFNYSSRIPSIIPCSFNWFSVTIVSCLKLIALTDLMEKNKWKSDYLVDASNRKCIKNIETIMCVMPSPKFTDGEIKLPHILQ